MIFMGDEWGATTPFQFFVNFENDSALEEAIRKGRAKEFENFKSFGGEDAASIVPDPTALQTFEQSRLDWSEPDREPFASVLRETRDLLALRRDAIFPVLNSGFVEAHFERLGDAGLDVTWRFEGATLRLIANFGNDPLTRPKPSDAKVLWQSDSATAGALIQLPSWAAIMMKSDAA